MRLKKNLYLLLEFYPTYFKNYKHFNGINPKIPQIVIQNRILNDLGNQLVFFSIF